jgi:hypothetical protein
MFFQGAGVRSTRSIWFWIGTASVGLLMICGATTGAVPERGPTVPSYRDPGIIAILPFFVSGAEGGDRRLVRCPSCLGYTAVGEVLPEGPQVITSLFRQRLITSGRVLVSQETLGKALRMIPEQAQDPEVLTQRLGSEMKVNSVLMGWVFRYSERMGNAWGARKPASVSFGAVLFDGRDGKLLWRGKFDETQKALSENLLNLGSFVRRGGRWLTARQLAADGVNRVLLNFPGEGQVGVNR